VPEVTTYILHQLSHVKWDFFCGQEQFRTDWLPEGTNNW